MIVLIQEMPFGWSVSHGFHPHADFPYTPEARIREISSDRCMYGQSVISNLSIERETSLFVWKWIANGDKCGQWSMTNTRDIIWTACTVLLTVCDRYLKRDFLGWRQDIARESLRTDGVFAVQSRSVVLNYSRPRDLWRRSCPCDCIDLAWCTAIPKIRRL
jgi:hypothetical protein